MLHQILFLTFYLGLLPAVFISPFAGALLYHWLDYLPPDEVYLGAVLPGYVSLTTGALTFVVWLFRENKTLPRPLTIILLMAALLVWINVTWRYALVPEAGSLQWDRTIKVIGFAILTAQMLSTRARLEAFLWALVLSVAYYAVPSAIKVFVSGGSGGIGTGEVVQAAWGSFFGDRVTLSVVMAMTIPFALYFTKHNFVLPANWRKWVRIALLWLVAAMLVSLIGTFARTALFAGGATLLMLVFRSKRKILSTLVVAVITLTLLLIAPDNWFDRMATITQYQSDESAMARIQTWKWAWEFALSHPVFGGGFGVFTLDAGSFTSVGRGWNEAHNIFFEMLAEHGFVGVGLFCLLILAIYASCTSVRKQVRGREDLLWAADLAAATQIGLVAFLAGGCFVSIASNPYLYMLAGITVGTRSLVSRELRTSTATRSRPIKRRLEAVHTAIPQPAK
jgi:probable O-glycosylation ligase (exosortase A-associated)